MDEKRRDYLAKCVLGCILLDCTALSVALQKITSEDLYAPVDRDIFVFIKSEYDKTGTAPDMVSICNRYISDARFTMLGGISQYVIQLQDMAITASSVEALCSKLVAIRNREKVYNEATILLQALKSDKPLDDVVSNFLAASEKILLNTDCTGSWIIDSMKSAVQKSLDVASGKSPPIGLKTGYSDLDRILRGLRPGSLTIIAGRPGMGKTALALNIMLNMAKHDISCVIFSLEMTSEELAERMIAIDAEIVAHDLRSGTLTESEYSSVFTTLRSCNKARIFVNDDASVTISSLCEKAKLYCLRDKLDIIFVDYIQLLEGKNKSSREQEISSISRSLKLLAKSVGVPVVAMSQLNRCSESRVDKRPLLSDLRESGSLEQDADNVLLIHRDYYYSRNEQTKNVAELIIAKQRGGMTGSINLYWDGAFTKFKNAQFN